jgi:F0F1-type ATP synthase assembly protein I
LGWYIDSSRGTKPIGILVGLGIGLITGFYHLAKTIWTRKR